jgi:hypothetical protein
MTVTKLADLTLDELRAIIQQEIRQSSTIQEGYARLLARRHSGRTYQEIMASVERNRAPEVAGAPSVVELLRADRDSQCVGPHTRC